MDEEVSPEQLELRKASERMQVAIDRATELLAASHQHEFMYLLNANHTALRGCKCGLAFVGLMAGPSPDVLQWHQVHEAGE
jgi:hypothetical protein